jgi:hypothetical protein
MSCDTMRLGSLQASMYRRGWRHLPNALSSLRYYLWRLTGGKYECERVVEK